MQSEPPTTPALLLDWPRMLANIRRLARHLDRLGVPLRPHLKTCKNIDIARQLLENQPGSITVSTLAEADYFFGHGLSDILYAVGIAPGKLPDVSRRIADGMQLRIVLDHPDTARAVADAARQWGTAFRLLLEVDADGHRAGFHPDDPQLVATARNLEEAGCHVDGVMVHAGGSYQCRDTAGIRAMAERERFAATGAAAHLRAAGFDAPIVSVGSTPTATFADSFSGVTEARAGVHVFQDLVQAGLGVCRIEDIALSVLTEVTGHRADRGELMVDAGWMALSRDRGTADQAIDQGYGLVCTAAGEVLDDVIVIETSQEHGIIGQRNGRPLQVENFPPGTRLWILPNHACATAAQHDGYRVCDTDRPADMRWLARCRGW